jgi:hypothetical protein
MIILGQLLPSVFAVAGAVMILEFGISINVWSIAQVYEDFSGNQFTREKGQGVWTESARWVAKVARMLTPEGERSPTDSELNTAMRYVVRDLRDRPYVPWLDDDSAGSESLQELPA